MNRQSAHRVANGLFDTIETLGDMPARGNFPKELDYLGRRDIRELHCGAYRIFYQIEERGVFVIAVADGRRDMREFLRRRLER